MEQKNGLAQCHLGAHTVHKVLFLYNKPKYSLTCPRNCSIIDFYYEEL